MKIVTVHVTLNGSGVPRWDVWRGMKMAEVDIGKWVRYHSLLEFTIPPKDRIIIDDRGIVENGFFYENPSGGFLLLKEKSYPDDRVYVCLEIDSGSHDVRNVGSFGCRFGYPIMWKKNGSWNDRRSYVWEVSNNGCVEVSLAGKIWRIWNRNKRVIVVAPQNGNSVVAEDILYGTSSAKVLEVFPHPTPAHHRPLLQNIPRLLAVREQVLHGLWWIDDKLAELGHRMPSRYLRLSALVERPERSFRQQRR